MDISALCKKLCYTTGALSRLRSSLPTQAKLNIYYALFASHTEYCGLVWQQRLRQIWNKSPFYRKNIRHITNVLYFSPTRNLFETYNIIGMDKMYFFRLLRLYYLSSDTLRNILTTVASLKEHNHPLNTRNTDLWIIPRFRTNHKLQMLQHIVPIILNTYPCAGNFTLKYLREYFVHL